MYIWLDKICTYITQNAPTHQFTNLPTAGNCQAQICQEKHRLCWPWPTFSLLRQETTLVWLKLDKSLLTPAMLLLLLFFVSFINSLSPHFSFWTKGTKSENANSLLYHYYFLPLLLVFQIRSMIICVLFISAPFEPIIFHITFTFPTTIQLDSSTHCVSE